MKKTLLMVFTVSAMFCAPACYSQCQVEASRPVIDYGRLNISDIQQSHKRWVSLDENDVMVTALCSEPKQMALLFTGDTDGKGFRFGEHGTVSVVAGSATLDGRQVKLGKSHTVGYFQDVLIGKANRLILNNTQLLPVDNGTSLSGQQFSVMLRLTPVLKANNSSLTDSQELSSALNIKVLTND